MGLALASELSEWFNDVTVLERNYFYRESSAAAGGMLAPVTEVEYSEPELLNFSQRCLRMYPEYVEKLADETGVDPGFRAGGTVMTGLHSTHRKEVRRLYEYQKTCGLDVEWIGKAELDELVPGLRDSLEWGLYAPNEKSVNNRLLGLGLLRRCRERGVELRTHEPVKRINYGAGETIEGVTTTSGDYRSDKLVLAAGAWTGQLTGLRPVDQLPIRPVKGQALSLKPGGTIPPDPILRTPDFYGISHPAERFLIGATMEEKGFSEGNTAGAILDLLDAVNEVFPKALNRPLLETWWGYRPATPDSKPVIGPSASTQGLYFTTGHYRKGILQSPYTAKLLRKCLVDEVLPEKLVPFRPGRFQEDEQTSNQNTRATGETNLC